MANEKEYKVITQQLEIKKENGMTIRGLVYRPDVDGEFPAVIFSHGFDGKDSDDARKMSIAFIQIYENVSNL